MTLYDRLKPEYREIMDTYAGDRPLTHRDAKMALLECESWLDLTYGQFISIKSTIGEELPHPRHLFKDA